jgi:hypothetical protein
VKNDEMMMMIVDNEIDDMMLMVNVHNEMIMVNIHDEIDNVMLNVVEKKMFYDDIMKIDDLLMDLVNDEID